MGDDRLQLSRRKILAGTGAIGLAGAGAGLGTSALFSDTESFANNSIQAGTLNLELEGEIVYTNRSDGMAPAVGSSTETTVDGESKTLITFEDVKPGDCYVVRTAACIEGNPAYLWGTAELVANDENSVTEPEADEEAEISGNLANPNTSETDADIDGEGELAQSIETSLYWGGSTSGGSDPYQFDQEGDGPDQGDKDALIANQPQLGDTTPLDKFLRVYDQNVFGELGPSNQPNVFQPGRCYYTFWVFDVPAAVGNEIQSDSLTFSVGARVQQARNNAVGSIDIEDQTAGAPIPLPGSESTIARAEIARVKYIGETDLLAVEPPPVKRAANLVSNLNSNVPAVDAYDSYFLVGLHDPDIGSGAPDMRDSLIGIAPLPTGSYEGVTVPIAPTPFTDTKDSNYPPSSDTEVAATLWHGPGGSETGPITDSSDDLYMDTATVRDI